MGSSPESERRIIDRLLRENLALKQEVSALTELSYVDPVTGLKNRRYYDERLASEIQRSRRRQEPLSVVVADVDDFKTANDTFGHQIGDKVLRWIATTLLGSVRDHDVVCRIGGDEFALIFTGVGETGARKLIQRMQARIQAGAAMLLPPGCRVSVSMGLATLRLDDRRAVGELFEAADAAMYHEKTARKLRAPRC